MEHATGTLIKMEHTTGTLIKTETIHGLFHGLVTDWYYCDDDQYISIEVTWNDCDNTTETFNEYDESYDTVEYFFYHKGRWWPIDENFYKFKQVLEG